VTLVEEGMTREFDDKDLVDAHDQCQQWRRENPGGYFLNLRGPRTAMLHHVACSHIGDTEYDGSHWGSLTKKKKVCSTNEDALRQWATSNYIEEIKVCSDCM
jgi:hypothetical protein